jgi:hypothetical protein
MTVIEQEILEAVRRLNPQQQVRVLEFARAATLPSGTTFAEMRAIARGIAFSSEDLEEMARIIGLGSASERRGER